MDIDKYSKDVYIKVDDLVDGPRREKIVDVLDGKYDKPDVLFESGNKLGLNATNRRTLKKAFGRETNSWAGRMVELYIGEVKFNNEARESVLIKPITPPNAQAQQAKPKPKKGGDAYHRPVEEDEIPFNT